MTKFQEYIAGSQKILLISSNPLDLDSISSGVVMKKYLEFLGLDVTYRFPRKLQEVEFENYTSLPYFDEVVCENTFDLINKQDYDTLILLDSGTWTKFFDYENSNSKILEIPKNKKIIRIDHHKDGSDYFGEKQIVNVDSSSTIELILSEVVPLDFLDSKLASLSYFGIIGDTGNFKWNFFPNTFKIASSLLERGADPKEMIERWSVMSLEDSKALAYVLNNIEHDPKTGTSFLFLSYEKLQKDGIDDNFLVLVKKAFKDKVARYVKGYPRGILMTEANKGNMHLSTRGSANSNQVDFTLLLKDMGGKSGGHFNAAGVDVEADFEEFKSKLMSKLNRMLQELSF